MRMSNAIGREPVMRIEMEPGALRLARGQTLRVTGASGQEVRCAQGSVWITEQGLPQDVVLESGRSYRLRRNGLALVHAFGEATVALG